MSSRSRTDVTVLTENSLPFNKRLMPVPGGASQAQISQLINIAGNVMLGPIGTSIGPTVSKPAAR
jgi:hypothetical protein